MIKRIVIILINSIKIEEKYVNRLLVEKGYKR